MWGSFLKFTSNLIGHQQEPDEGSGIELQENTELRLDVTRSVELFERKDPHARRLQTLRLKYILRTWSVTREKSISAYTSHQTIWDEFFKNALDDPFLPIDFKLRCCLFMSKVKEGKQLHQVSKFIEKIKSDTNQSIPEFRNFNVFAREFRVHELEEFALRLIEHCHKNLNAMDEKMALGLVALSPYITQLTVNIIFDLFLKSKKWAHLIVEIRPYVNIDRAQGKISGLFIRQVNADVEREEWNPGFKPYLDLALENVSTQINKLFDQLLDEDAGVRDYAKTVLDDLLDERNREIFEKEIMKRVQAILGVDDQLLSEIESEAFATLASYLPGEKIFECVDVKLKELMSGLSEKYQDSDFKVSLFVLAPYASEWVALFVFQQYAQQFGKYGLSSEISMVLSAYSKRVPAKYIDEFFLSLGNVSNHLTNDSITGYMEIAFGASSETKLSLIDHITNYFTAKNVSPNQGYLIFEVFTFLPKLVAHVRAQDASKWFSYLFRMAESLVKKSSNIEIKVEILLQFVNCIENLAQQSSNRDIAIMIGRLGLIKTDEPRFENAVRLLKIRYLFLLTDEQEIDHIIGKVAQDIFSGELTCAKALMQTIAHYPKIMTEKRVDLLLCPLMNKLEIVDFNRRQELLALFDNLLPLLNKPALENIVQSPHEQSFEMLCVKLLAESRLCLENVCTMKYAGAHYVT